MLARWSGWHCGSTGRSSKATGTKVGTPSYPWFMPISCVNPCHTPPVCLLIAALEKLWIVELQRINALAHGGEGYTAAQYAEAAVKLLDAKHNAVLMQDMLALLGRHVVGGTLRQWQLASPCFNAWWRSTR